MADLRRRLGPVEDKVEPVSEKIIEGDGSTPTSVTFHPAMVAAKKMEKKIHDQLNESGASKHLRSMAFEMALLGTGVMKGHLLQIKSILIGMKMVSTILLSKLYHLQIMYLHGTFTLILLPPLWMMQST